MKVAEQSKRVRQAYQGIDRTKRYRLMEAIQLIKKAPKAKFDESVDLAFYLGVDPKKSDQAVRGVVGLPHGTGKKVRVVVFCKGEAEKNAREAGADFVGAEDLIKKVEGGWLDFDVVVSTPDLMKDVGKLGRILGPKGLMPNPKAGTVTTDVAKAVKEVKAGRVEFKVDKQGNINLSVGKLSFTEQAIGENALQVIEAVVHQRPSAVKGIFIKGIALSSTMGPGLKLDLSEFNVN